MVMRGGRGKEAGGTAFGNMGLDQELHLEVELGRTGPQMGSWAGSGPLVHHSLSISSGRAGALLEMWQNYGVGRMVFIYIMSKVAGGTDGACFTSRVVGRTDTKHPELCEWMASKGSGQLWI